MKLFTEKQVKEAMGAALYSNKMWTHDDIIMSLKPIELLSDEEIDKASRVINKEGLSWENDFASDSFFNGAIWIKRQILKQIESC